MFYGGAEISRLNIHTKHTIQDGGTTKEKKQEQIMTLCGDWLWLAVQWSMLSLKEATLIARDSRQNCQQYENEINKSVAGREMKEAAGKKKRKV